MMITDTDRLSVRYYNNTQEEIEHYSSMFLEDFYRNVVPVYASKQEAIKCILEPENKEFERVLIELLPSHTSKYNRSFSNAILGSIQYIAQYLVYHGQIIFEFVTLKDINERILYKLEMVFGEEIEIKDNNIIQVIPKDAAEHLQIESFPIIPVEKCFIIDFPKVLGGKKKYLDFVKEFKALGQQSPMMGFLESSLSGQKGYDRTEHQQLHELELWEKSKIYNWHHRGSYDKLFTGYYHIYRHLLFKKSQILLRDFIIEKLKQIVSDLSKRLGYNAELKIEGLVTTERIDEVLEQWQTGSLKPNTITEIL